MRIPRTGSFYFALFLLTLMTLLIAIATQYNRNAALVPLVVGIPTALLIVVEMVREQVPAFSKFLKVDVLDAKRARPEAAKVHGLSGQRLHKELTAILIVIGFTLLVLAVGFLIAIPVFSFLYMILFAGESWGKALAAAFFTWLFIYLIFCALMEIRFPWSFLF